MTRASSAKALGQGGQQKVIGTKIVEAPAEVLDEGMAGDDDAEGTVSLQPAHRAKSLKGSETRIILLTCGFANQIDRSLRKRATAV